MNVHAYMNINSLANEYDCVHTYNTYNVIYSVSYAPFKRLEFLGGSAEDANAHNEQYQQFHIRISHDNSLSALGMRSLFRRVFLSNVVFSLLSFVQWLQAAD